MKTKSIMIQGTASSVGKSILATALCRIFTQDGYRVAPFKSQNMSLNSFITVEGHEIGRAQVMQAEAARKLPNVKMNPILLKPTSDRRSQVIVNGKVMDHVQFGTMDAEEYFQFKNRLKETILEQYNDLAMENDIMVLEGAGSPAEINLKQNDIVNMGMAKMANSPVILVGDIDKGGVFASLYGTMMLLDEEERNMVKGVIINKFRGSVEILQPGLKMLEDLINVPVLGVVPYFRLNIEDEDSVTDWSQYSENQEGDLDVVVIKLPYMSNFTDFNALRMYPDVRLRFIENKKELGSPDLIILPGSKSTISDLQAIQESGLVKEILQCHKKGSYILGICGGYQMLGQAIVDEEGIESETKRINGLRLLPMVTHFVGEKTTTLSEGKEQMFGYPMKGYEIHMGRTDLLEECTPFVHISRRGQEAVDDMDGAINKEKNVFGTYLHGVFDNPAFTRTFFNRIREKAGKRKIEEQPEDYWYYKDRQYDALAEIFRQNVDMQAIYQIMEEGLND